MKSTIFMTKPDIISNFGIYLSQKTLLKLDSVKDFCAFFTSGINTVRVSETPVSPSGKGTYLKISDLEKEFSENKLKEIFEKMQYIINDRQEKINKYNKSNLLNKAIYKISGIISSDTKEASDPEYVQKGIDYLKEKTIEDIREKIEFVFEKDESDIDQVIAVPKYIDFIMNNSYIFMPIKKIKESVKIENVDNAIEELKDNFINSSTSNTVSKIKIKNLAIALSKTDNGQKYIRMIFETEDGTFLLDLNDNDEFILSKNNSRKQAFFNNIDAIDYAINENVNKIKNLTKEIDLIKNNIIELEKEKAKNLLELN